MTHTTAYSRHSRSCYHSGLRQSGSLRSAARLGLLSLLTLSAGTLPHANGLQLQVLTSGAPSGRPAPAVSEASTTISFGLLLMLGGLVVAVKRKAGAAAC